MKVLRAGILAVAVLSSFSSLAPSPVAAEEAVAVDPGFAAAELMAVSGVDLVFAQFAATIADSAQSQGITTDAHFLATWERTALAAFDAATLNSALEIALTGAFTSDEQAALEGFYNSDFGRRVVGIEKAVQTMAPSDQTAAVAQGLAAFEALAADSRRLAQIEELLVLAGAELTPELVRQSSRSLMLGMSLVEESDIEVPWEAIDAQLDSQMPAIEREVRGYQQALSAYAYRDLSDDELETYLEFLRTAPARKFYGIFVPAVAQIISAAMARFGAQLAQNLTEEMT